jgi:hypothetical protein
MGRAMSLIMSPIAVDYQLFAALQQVFCAAHSRDY